MTINDITQILTNHYNRKDWKIFLNNLFLSTNIFNEPEVLTDINADFVYNVLKIGFINVNENNIIRNIGIFEVELGEGIVLEKNRVGLRNLLRKYWKDLDGAFIVYFRASSKSWRFTYVSELSGIDDEGNYKDIKTDPKRYTYVFGEGESCKTAAERFFILFNKKNNISLDDIKEAFSVEKLSKSFFADYKKLYDLFCNYLTNNQSIFKSIFKGDEKEVRDFVKLLLGRITFLYFIQKKGWLGVAINGNWGDGDNSFLSNLFNQYQYKKLFYGNILTKLFFDSLNTPREDDIIELIEGEKIKIPFLNGGLFEEHESKYRNIVFEEILFKNLFDFFDMYNFTIYEDDPNDHTVAVDPEMLGHIFENLLEDNKDKGAYYTPKEIVHYMCRESLIEYLATWFEKNDYTVIGNDLNENGNIVADVTNKKSINKTLLENLFKKKLTKQDEECLINYYEQINIALDKVKICDPAIGSGAFPMGLLQEIFTAKQTLWYIKNANLNNFPASDIKLNIIQNSIYGVDIEKGAVDIARLRFWLSLVVDEETPKPLPNLDYKIVVGNSLVSKFGDDIIDIDWDVDVTAYGYVGHELAIKTKELLELIINKQKKYFSPLSNKKELFLEIRNLKIDLLINQLELMLNTSQILKKKAPGSKANKNKNLYIQQLSWADNIKRLKRLKKEPSGSLNFFDWKLDFPEIFNPEFNTNPGFDIVIGNPPWVSLKGKFGVEENKRNSLTYLQDKYNCSTYRPNIFEFFIINGLSQLRQDGIFSFIIPDRLGFNSSLQYLRNRIINNFLILQIVYKWNFEQIIADTMTLLIKKSTAKYYYFSIKNRPDQDFLLFSNEFINKMPLQIFRSYEDNKTKHLIEKILMNSSPLSPTFCEAATGFIGVSKLISHNRINNSQIPIVKGQCISRYFINKKYYYELIDMNIIGGTKDRDKLSIREKILIRKTGNEVIAALSSESDIPEQSLYFLYDFTINSKYILAILNSKMINWFYNKQLITNEDSTPQLKIYDLYSIPIKAPDLLYLNKIVMLIDNILLNKNNSTNINIFQNQIDIIIFKLYNLEFIEVKIIDPDFSMTEEEYNNFKII